ncbi:MAG: response regulator [bacterium]
MPYKILLVDDDKDFREEFCDYFEDFQVIETSTGRDAIKLLKEPNDIDVVILDVVLPDLRGTEVLRKMKKIAPDLDIIILTGYSSKDIAIEALKGHADDYIEKPINIDKMNINKIKEIIERMMEEKKGKIDTDSIDIEDKINKVKRFIERNYDKNISLKAASKVVCLSPKYLSRIFKENTGMGFNEYKLRIKTEKAKKLLKNTGYNINQISFKLGYLNPESFLRIFKKFTGLTPTEYRKNIQ